MLCHKLLVFVLKKLFYSFDKMKFVRNYLKTNMLCVLLILVLIFYPISSAGVKQTDCESKGTCTDCIQTLGCVWCSKPEPINGNKLVHCMSDEILLNNFTWCPSETLVNPQKLLEIVEAKPLESDEYNQTIQISPQKVKLSLRKDEEFELKFQYKRAKNYPIDLYYLIDISWSMKPHKDKLAKLRGTLVEVMRNITSDFRLGFGCFIEKPMYPFADVFPEMLECKDWPTFKKCSSKYNFKNHMPLTDNFKAFSDYMREIEAIGNFDSPEASSDAIMQAIVCKKEIGWRENARHLLIMTTDASLHVAGDGKLVGIFEPNDATCHLENGEYIRSTTMDYPSISQINFAAKQNNINLIFAIAPFSKVESKTYELLQDQMENSAMGILSHDSSNVVKLILDNYNKIAGSVTLKDDAGDDVKIKYSSTCSNPKENGCKEVPLHELVNFTASIRPLKCHNKKQFIKIKPDGINEYLLIELEIQCECDCEKPNHPDFQFKSTHCSQNGNLQCGICKCNKGYFGKKCECDARTSHSDDESDCRTNPGNEVCSGLGYCLCGTCHCVQGLFGSETFYGKYCECDNFSCKRKNGQLCSGKMQGQCECGHCKCLPGWTGETCECPDNNATCVAPNGQDICSDHGNCICGVCVCENVGGHNYYGKYCDECPSCPGQRCNELRECVECHFNNTLKHNQSKCADKCTYDVEIVKKIDQVSNENKKICKILDSSGCALIYQYTYDENMMLHVNVQETKRCPEKVNLLVIGLIVMGTIVFAGVVSLIIWKVATMYHDLKEYQKFEKERSQAKWNTDDNPLYKSAATEYRNPLYYRPKYKRKRSKISSD